MKIIIDIGGGGGGDSSPKGTGFDPHDVCGSRR